MSKSYSSAILLLPLLHLLCPVTSRPQTEASTLHGEGEKLQEEEWSSVTRALQDPLRWVWLDSTSLSLEWPSHFSLSINGAVTAYSLSLTHPHHHLPTVTTTMFHSPTLRHQFEGLRSNVTYAGRLMALVGAHHWPYTLLNFTVTSPTLHTGFGLGQRPYPARPLSSTADLDAITVSVTLRWSSTPFLKGNGEDKTQRPTGYRLRVWDHKQLVTQVLIETPTHTQDCQAAVGGLTLDSVYKATLEAVMSDGEPGISLTFTLDAGALHVAGGGLTTDGVSECYSGLQVRCPGSERCVSPYWICDGAPDCPDGVDEEGCDTTTCDGFQCWEDVCIPWAWNCDGYIDCKGGDDELEYKCSSCGDHELRCPWGGGCLQTNATCDGVAHCRDGWDESAALCGSVTCKPGELRCLGGSRCVPHQWLCDSVSDCPAAEDEDTTFCSAFNSFRNNNLVFNITSESVSSCEDREIPKRVNCTSDEFQCDSRSCIPREYVCDGVRDCKNGRDELPQSCSHTTSKQDKPSKLNHDSEEELSDLDKLLPPTEDGDECNEEENGMCRNPDTHTDRRKEVHSPTTESSQTHNEEASPSEKIGHQVIENDLSEVKPVTTIPTTTTTATTTRTTISKSPSVNIVEENMTDVEGNEIDVSLIEYSDSVSVDKDVKTIKETNKSQNGVNVNVEVFVEEDEKEEPSFSQPEIGINLSSIEEYEYEDASTLDIDQLSPHGKENVRKNTNKTSIQIPSVLTEVINNEDVMSYEESDLSEENENDTLSFPPHYDQIEAVTQGLEGEYSTDDYYVISEEDDALSVITEGSISTIQMMSTSEVSTGTEATMVNVTLPLPADDGITHTSTNLTTTMTTTRQDSLLSDIPDFEITSTSASHSLNFTLSPKDRHFKTTSLPSTVNTEGLITPEDTVKSEELPHPVDVTSLNPVIMRNNDTTATTTSSYPMFTSDKSETAALPTAQNHLEESTIPPFVSQTVNATTDTPIEEMVQKNLTILIAIRAGLNESEIPQYTIQSADGNTYQYKIVSIVKEEVTQEKDVEELQKALEEEEEITNEIRGDRGHQFLQGINISPATKSSSGSCFFIFFLALLLFIMDGLGIK